MMQVSIPMFPSTRSQQDSYDGFWIIAENKLRAKPIDLETEEEEGEKEGEEEEEEEFSDATTHTQVQRDITKRTNTKQPV